MGASCTAGGSVSGAAMRETARRILRNLETELGYDPAAPLQGGIPPGN